LVITQVDTANEPIIVTLQPVIHNLQPPQQQIPTTIQHSPQQIPTTIQHSPQQIPTTAVDDYQFQINDIEVVWL